jgi:hypothetical protein
LHRAFPELPDRKFESLSLRHQKQARRTAGWESRQNPADFFPRFRLEEFGGPSQRLFIGAAARPRLGKHSNDNKALIF